MVCDMDVAAVGVQLAASRLATNTPAPSVPANNLRLLPVYLLRRVNVVIRCLLQWVLLARQPRWSMRQGGAG